MAKDLHFFPAAPGWFVKVGEEYRRVPFWVFLPEGDPPRVVAGGRDKGGVFLDGTEFVHWDDMTAAQRLRSTKR